MTELAKTTLYIRNIPAKTTNEELSEFFSTVGPVKSAFGIVPKFAGDAGEQETKCGFVHFAMAQDAQNSLTELKKKRLNGSILKLELAKHRNRKPVDAKEDDEEFDLEANPFEPAAEPVEESKEKKEKPLIDVKKVKQLKDISRTVLISGLDPKLVDRKQLFKKVKKFGDVVEIQYPFSNIQSTPALNSESLKKHQALVRFKSVLDAKKAVAKLDNHIFKGETVKSCIHPSIAEAKRSNRVVIRNMKFSTTVDNIWNALVVYGPIMEITLPQNVQEENKNKGFGFVTFARKDDAEAAMTAVNGNVVEEFGRLVILDYVKPKDEYENSKEKQVAEVVPEADSDMEHGDEIDRSESEGEDDDDDDDIDVDMDEDLETEASPKLNMNDADEGRTLFVRNLSFNTSDEALKEKFEEFGKVDYARIVMDRVTGMPKGTGFVKMASSEDADKIMSMQQVTDGMEINSNLIPESSSMITLDSRPLHVLRALTKSTLNDSDETRSSKTTIQSPNDKDRRNIYLLREILYNADSPVYSTLSEKFLDSLRELHKSRVKKLRKQMHMSVSRTRLSIRHLGKTISEDQIKKKCFDSVKQFQQILKRDSAANRQSVKHQREFAAWKSEGLFHSIKVKHVKLMKDKVTEKSMGYGFVEFDNHAQALACMRQIKNSEESQGSNGRRWVLEFAVENTIILRQRIERLEKSKQPRTFEFKRDSFHKKDERDSSKKAPNKFNRMEKSKQPRASGFKRDVVQKKDTRDSSKKFAPKESKNQEKKPTKGFKKTTKPFKPENGDNKRAPRDLKQGKRKTIKQ